MMPKANEISLSEVVKSNIILAAIKEFKNKNYSQALVFFKKIMHHLDEDAIAEFTTNIETIIRDSDNSDYAKQALAVLSVQFFNELYGKNLEALSVDFHQYLMQYHDSEFWIHFIDEMFKHKYVTQELLATIFSYAKTNQASAMEFILLKPELVDFIKNDTAIDIVKAHINELSLNDISNSAFSKLAAFVNKLISSEEVVDGSSDHSIIDLTGDSSDD